MIISEFWSYALAILLEIIKAALVITATVFLAKARDEFIGVWLRTHPHRSAPFWMHHSKYYDVSKLPDCEVNWSFRRDAIRLFLISLAFFAAFVLLQFGLCRAIAISWYRLGVGVFIYLVYGLGAVVGEGPDGHDPTWRSTLLGLLGFVCAGFIIIDVVQPLDYPGHRFSQSDEVVVVTRSEAIYLDSGRHLKISLDTEGGSRVELYDIPDSISATDSDVAVRLVEDSTVQSGESAPFIIRKEVVSYTLDHSPRFFDWTVSRRDYTVLEYHYGSLDDNIRLVLPDELNLS